MSMLREALYNDPEREIHLIYGSRNEHTMLFKDELLRYAKNFANFKLTLVFSEPVSIIQQSAALSQKSSYLN